VKDDQRNRLKGDHFNAAVHLSVQRIYTTYTAPYRSAIKYWHEQQARRPNLTQEPAERPLGRQTYKAVVDVCWGAEPGAPLVEAASLCRVTSVSWARVHRGWCLTQ
jgi:hypothetical protein